MRMHDCRHESNDIGGASDAESSRVDARQSTVVGDASSSWQWYICTIKTMFMFERCDAMPHNYDTHWLDGSSDAQV